MTAKQRHRARKWERGDIHPTYTPLPIDTCERLESYASMMGISRADAIRQACAEFLARHHDEICRYEVGTIRSRYDRDTRAIQAAEACRECLDKVTGKAEAERYPARKYFDPIAAGVLASLDAPDGPTRGEEAAPAIPAHEEPESASQGTPEGKESF